MTGARGLRGLLRYLTSIIFLCFWHHCCALYAFGRWSDICLYSKLPPIACTALYMCSLQFDQITLCRQENYMLHSSFIINVSYLHILLPGNPDSPHRDGLCYRTVEMTQLEFCLTPPDGHHCWMTLKQLQCSG